MLKRLPLACILAALLAPAALGQDDEPDDGFHRPDRLTAAMGDQFLGQLAPDQKTLYFVSSRNTTSEIFVQDVEEGRSRRLFDDGADVTWPRVSPDGRSLLYVSFRDVATGQLCVRDLPDGEGRRCLDASEGALEAEWIDASRIALVSRTSIRGGLRVLEVAVGDALHSRPLLDRDVTSPAVSPDGRWLVYVPIERTSSEVGPAFAAHAGSSLEALRLDRKGPPLPFRLDLPGLTAQPAFSRDGQSLYFVQFYVDSNGDGIADASDHGVLFRVPFPTDRDDAPAVAATAFPRQLTDSGWNCEYPAPAEQRLVVTCSRRQALDVYELPLSGELPSDWDDARLQTGIELSDRRAEQLLLYRRRLALEPGIEGRRLLLVRLVRLHLDFDDVDAADFYAASIAKLPDPATAGLSRPLRILVAHRRAVRDREVGREVASFGEASRRRLLELRPKPGDSLPSLALAALIRSEIADSLGDVGTSRRELESVEIGPAIPRPILELFYERADALYRRLDDREALWSACQRLAAQASLPPDARMQYALATARTLVRGLPASEAEAALAREARRAAAGSELAFALGLQRATLALRDADPPPPQLDALLSLYRSQSQPDRRRAVVLEVVERAAQVGADRAVELLAQRYLEDVPKESAERRRAERLYRRALVGRAFRRLGEGKPEAALADFEAVVRRTGGLESALEAIHLRLERGESSEALLAEGTPFGPGIPKAVDDFVRAYLLARRLPHLEGSEHARVAHEARALLRSDWAELRNRRLARALYGSVLAQDFFRTGDLADAERANAQLLVALELSEGNPRYRAMILGALGILQTAVGNDRIALSYLEERRRLPEVDDPEDLAVDLTRARALFHVDREAEAALAADRLLERTEKIPALRAFRPLALDRAALYNLAAHHFDRSLELYGDELAALGKGASARNRFVARLGHAASALGAAKPELALGDLADAQGLLGDPRFAAAIAWRPDRAVRAHDRYALILAGLRANAHQRLGQLGEAARALEDRHAAFAHRYDLTRRDDDLRALVLADSRLAENACRRGDVRRASDWIGDAVSRADALAIRTTTPISADRLDALWFAAELSALDGASLPFDVKGRIDGASSDLARTHDPAWRAWEGWFEVYLALGLK